MSMTSETPAGAGAARFAQGIAAAMASAVVLGMVVALFPEPGERARAMGVYAFVGAAGASIGILLGGTLTATLGWRSIFLVNIPIGVAAALLTLRFVASDRPAARTGHPDVLGGLLVTGGLMALVYAIVADAVPLVRLAVLVAAALLLAGFVVRQRRVPEPLVRLGIFASRAVTGGNLAQLLMVAGMLGFQYVMALYLQQALGYPPAATGLAMLPIPVVIAAVSLLVAGRVINRLGAVRVLLGAEVVLVAGLALLTRPPTGSYLLDLLPSMVVLGVGAGFALPAVNTVIMSDATGADAGLASGLANTSQQVGGALGTSVLAVLAAARAEGALAAGADLPDALGSGFRSAFAAGALAVAAAFGVTWTVRQAGRGPVPR